jgi:hypothetical protein
MMFIVNVVVFFKAAKDSYPSLQTSVAAAQNENMCQSRLQVSYRNSHCYRNVFENARGYSRKINFQHYCRTERYIKTGHILSCLWSYLQPWF